MKTNLNLNLWLHLVHENVDFGMCIVINKKKFEMKESIHIHSFGNKTEMK
jgi:hypothetical protein